MPTTDTATPKPPALSEDQRARAAALDAARAVLAARSALSSSAPDAMDLVHVARFILDGRDPWGDPPATPATLGGLFPGGARPRPDQQLTRGHPVPDATTEEENR